jgi:uncharacterized protein (DUF58 family)
VIAGRAVDEVTAPTPILDPVLLRRLERLTLINRRRLASSNKGERRSVRRGSSLEFVDYRQYTPGDDLRQIDWNVYGRHNNLVLKLFEDEEVLAVHLLVDGSRSMDWGAPNKLAYARQVAAALGYVALAGYDTVDVLQFGAAGPEHFGPGRGRSGVAGLFRFLAAENQPATHTDLDGALRGFAARPRSPGLVLLFSDLLDPAGYQRALVRLRQQRHEVLLFHVLCPEELRPTVEGDLRLVDRESGEAMEVTVDRRALEAYGERLTAWLVEIGDFCRRHGIGYQQLDTSRPLPQLLFRDLRERGVLA